MEEIRRTSYARAIKTAKNNGFKNIIFFLFSKSDEHEKGYVTQLENICKNIDRNTGRDILFLSHYMSSKAEYENIYVEERKKVRDELNEGNKTVDGYKAMNQIARALGPDVQNRMPCFVILDVNDNQNYVVKSARDISSDKLFCAAMEIITNLQDVEYDICRYAKNHDQPHFNLSSQDLLMRDLDAISRGWRISELKQIFEFDDIVSCIDWEKMKALANKDGYISIKKFLRNINHIKIKDFESVFFSDFVDKGLLLLEGKTDKMIFEGISENIENTSKQYLIRAKMFKNSIDDELSTDRSLMVICLGKIVEDELNLGVFNAFRGAFSVSLPKYFDRFQPNLNPSTEIYYFNGNNQNVNKTIMFNQEDRNLSCKVKYPMVSDLRHIAFDPSCNSKKHRKAIDDARNDIDQVKTNITEESWRDVYNCLEQIANIRNKAIHHVEIVSKAECELAYKAFEKLVELHFFEVNCELKQIVKN